MRLNFNGARFNLNGARFIWDESRFILNESRSFLNKIRSILGEIRSLLNENRSNLDPIHPERFNLNNSWAWKMCLKPKCISRTSFQKYIFESFHLLFRFNLKFSTKNAFYLYWKFRAIWNSVNLKMTTKHQPWIKSMHLILPFAGCKHSIHTWMSYAICRLHASTYFNSFFISVILCMLLLYFLLFFFSSFFYHSFLRAFACLVM